ASKPRAAFIDGFCVDLTLKENDPEVLVKSGLKVMAKEEHQTEEGASRKGSGRGMLTVCSEVRNQGTVIPGHQGRRVRKEKQFSKDWRRVRKEKQCSKDWRRVRKEKQCSKDWRRVCSIGYETKRRVCPHTQEIQGIGQTTGAAKTLKAAIRVLALEKQSLLRNIIRKEPPRGERKHYQKVKEAQEGIGSRNQRSKSRALRTTCPNHGFVKKQILSPLGSITLTFQKPKCLVISKHMTEESIPRELPPAKKFIKDPVEIHNIKQRDRESMKEFMQSRRNDEGNYNIPQRRGGGLKREWKKSFPSWKQQEAGLKQNFKNGGFKNQQKPERKQTEKRNNSKVCEFHGEVGHTIDECMHLKRQIEEKLKDGKLSHLIKELKQSNGKYQAKVAKKGETPGKDKSLAIFVTPLKSQRSGIPLGVLLHSIKHKL
nr:reverse transcriptase domain-containing protein [Tanacetum cinerariifolium]GEZ90594.1 reverse transcriptase domain-containing protein [Tanacetum cinerariifolium]